MNSDIVMLTEYSMDKPNGSTMRIKWQYEALCRQGFTKISILDNFKKNIKKPSNSLFHAQQHSGRFLEKNHTYLIYMELVMKKCGINLFNTLFIHGKDGDFEQNLTMSKN